MLSRRDIRKLQTSSRVEIAGHSIYLEGNRTKTQEASVLEALKLAGEDITKLINLKIYNHINVNTHYRHEVTLGGYKKLTPELAQHLKDHNVLGYANRMHGTVALAGRCKDLPFVALHELGHLIRGDSEAEADLYAEEILGRKTTDPVE